MAITTSSPTLRLSAYDELFSTFWAKVNGNNAVGSESNMQLLKAFCDAVVADLIYLDGKTVNPFAVNALDVTSLTFDDSTNRLSWSAPSTSGQDGTTTLTYKVYLDGSYVTTVSTTYYNFSALAGGSHTFKVEAVWSVVFTPAATSTSSGASLTTPNYETLATPTVSLSINNGVGTLAIGNVSNATGYNLVIKVSGSSVHNETFSSSGTKTVNYVFTIGNTYAIELTATGSTYYGNSSAATASVDYQKTTLAAPAISTIVIDADSVDFVLGGSVGATGYEVRIKNPNDETVGTGTYNTAGNKSIAGSFAQGITYTIQAWAVSSNGDYTSLSSTTSESASYGSSGGGSGSNAVAFATDSWATVKAESERIAAYFKTNNSIPADTPYSVGDEREVTLSTNEVIKVAIMGFCHDDLTSAYSNGATKAGITLGMEDCLVAAAVMNAQNTNVGGWAASSMRTSMATYLSQLPSDLQAVITAANKKTSAGNQSSTIDTSSDSLWLFSIEEVFGTNCRQSGAQYSFAGEGTQYAYFAEAAIPSGFAAMNTGATAGTFVGNGTACTTRLGSSQNAKSPRYCNLNSYKGLGVAPAGAYFWWSRSPYYNSNLNFAYVTYEGYVSSTSANSEYGVSFGFCL